LDDNVPFRVEVSLWPSSTSAVEVELLDSAELLLVALAAPIALLVSLILPNTLVSEISTVLVVP
jgi:hypothetical protein